MKQPQRVELLHTFYPTACATFIARMFGRNIPCYVIVRRSGGIITMQPMYQQR